MLSAVDSNAHNFFKHINGYQKKKKKKKKRPSHTLACPPVMPLFFFFFFCGGGPENNTLGGPCQQLLTLLTLKSATDKLYGITVCCMQGSRKWVLPNCIRLFLPPLINYFKEHRTREIGKTPSEAVFSY